MTGPLRTRYIGGPFDGRTTLGRLRPEPLEMDAPLDASGPDSYAMPSFGGEYERTSPDRAVEDVYRWRPDVAEDAA